jgi:hypothetical protein
MSEEELSIRIKQLELALGTEENSSQTNKSLMRSSSIWDAIARLENRVDELESQLSPENEEQVGPKVGDECIALESKSARWLEAMVVAKPSAKTYVVKFMNNNNNTENRQCELLDIHVRVSKVDLRAVERAEDALRSIVRALRLTTEGIDNRINEVTPEDGSPPNVDHRRMKYVSLDPDGFDHHQSNADGTPLGVPLTLEGQGSVVEHAKEDMTAAAKHLESIYQDPLRLEQYIDSQSIRDLAGNVNPLLDLERKTDVNVKQAGSLSGEVRRLLEDYSEVISHLNEQLVYWDEASLFVASGVNQQHRQGNIGSDK